MTAAAPTRTVLARDLGMLLREVAGHACTDDTLPMLCAVAITATAGQLQVSATNRYTFAISTLDSPGPAIERTIVDRRDIAELIALCRSARRADQQITVAASRGGGLYFAFDRDLSVTYQQVETVPEGAKYPDLEGLLVKFRDTAPGPQPESVGLNPNLLSLFGTAPRTRHEPLSFRFAGRSAGVCVTAGSHFRGAIMPVRIGES